MLNVVKISTPILYRHFNPALKQFKTVTNFPKGPQSTCLEIQIFKGGNERKIFENFYTSIKIKENLYTDAFEFRLRALCNSICYCLFAKNCKIVTTFQGIIGGDRKCSKSPSNIFKIIERNY